MGKVKARANSNLALLKYWGRKNDQLRLPTNNSISVNLDNLVTETELEFGDRDVVVVDGEAWGGAAYERVVEFLDAAVGKQRRKVVVESKNSFPAATGLSSSASGFAALAAGVNELFGLGLGEKELTILARKGSGSACRSIPEGFVRWVTADADEGSWAETIFPTKHWDLRVLAVVLSEEVKRVPTSDGQRLAWSSPYFKARLEVIEKREKEMVEALERRDFEELAFCVEREMMEFHAIPMTSNPSLFYWYPATVGVIHLVREMRFDGLPVCSTVNTGHNVFVLTLPEGEEEVVARLEKDHRIKKIIRNKVGRGVEVLR